METILGTGMGPYGETVDLIACSNGEFCLRSSNQHGPFSWEYLGTNVETVAYRQFRERIRGTAWDQL